MELEGKILAKYKFTVWRGEAGCKFVHSANEFKLNSVGLSPIAGERREGVQDDKKRIGFGRKSKIKTNKFAFWAIFFNDCF